MIRLLCEICSMMILLRTWKSIKICLNGLLKHWLNENKGDDKMGFVSHDDTVEYWKDRAKKAEKQRDEAIKDIDILAESFYFESGGKNPCAICDNAVCGNKNGECQFCNETLGFRWRGNKE